MTRLPPEFPVGNLVVSDHSVRNCWLIPGDTPEKIRVYTTPWSLSTHQDIDVSTQCWGWSGLASGSLLRFSVSCIYPDGEEQSGSFTANTTGPNAGSGGGGQGGGGTVPATPAPPVQNLAVTVEPYLRHAVVAWDGSDKLITLIIDLHTLPNGSNKVVGTAIPNHVPGHQIMTIPRELLQYATTYQLRLTCNTGDANSDSKTWVKRDYKVDFATGDDPRFNDNPVESDKHVSISEAASRKKSLQLGDDRTIPVSEIDPEAGPHTRLSPP